MLSLPAGVYQEIMGSIHNGFGSLNTVVIKTQKEVEADAGKFKNNLCLPA